MTREQLDNYDPEIRDDANNLIMEIRMRLMDLESFARLQAGYTDEEMTANTYDCTLKCLDEIMEHHPMSPPTRKQWSEDNNKFLINAYISTTRTQYAMTVKTIHPQHSRPKWYKLVEDMQQTLGLIGKIIKSTNSFSPTSETKSAIASMHFTDKEQTAARSWLGELNLALENSLSTSTFQPLFKFTIPFYNNDDADERISFMRIHSQLPIDFENSSKK